MATIGAGLLLGQEKNGHMNLPLSINIQLQHQEIAERPFQCLSRWLSMRALAQTISSIQTGDSARTATFNHIAIPLIILEPPQHRYQVNKIFFTQLSALTSAMSSNFYQKSN